jgi:hypothetical protein
VVADKSRATSRRRVMPRVSKATGGLMPGIDLNDLSKLQDIEDLEYLERSGFRDPAGR